MDRQINIMDILKLYMKRWWCLLLAMVLGGVISAVSTVLFVVPMYTSYCTLYTENTADITNQNITEVNLSTVMVRKELVQTYAEILSSNTFLTRVAEQSDIGYTSDQILKMISMKDKNETEILVVSVTSVNPNHSHIIAQKIVDLAPEFVSDIVEGGSVKPLDLPKYSNSPSSPNLVRNIEVGMIIGLLISLVLVFTVEMLDNKVKDSDTVAEMFKYPILGEVPYFTSTSKKENNKFVKLIKNKPNKEKNDNLDEEESAEV